MKTAVVLISLPIPGNVKNEFLGIAYLTSYLNKYDIPCDYYNLNYHDNPDVTLIQALQDNKPTLVGITLIGHEFQSLKKILALIRQTLPKVRIVAGGHLASFTAYDLLHCYTDLDFVIVGEGEETLKELVLAITGNHAVDHVPNIIYRDENGNIIFSEQKDNIPDINSLPFPSRKYYREMSKFHIPFSIVLNRGCTQSCTFCSVGAFYKSLVKGKKWRSRSITNVLKEIDQLPFGPKRLVRFVDDNFFEMKSGENDIHDFTILLSKRNITYEASMRVPVLSSHILDIFYKSGLRSIYIGIESSNQGIRKKWGKNFSNKDIFSVIDYSSKLGILIRFGFMMFHPSMTWRTYHEDIDFLNDMIKYNIDYQDFIKTFFTALKAYPGTPLTRHLLRKNKLRGNPLQYGYYGYIMNDKRCTDLYLLSTILYKTYFKPIIYSIIPRQTALMVTKNIKSDFFCRELITFFRQIAGFIRDKTNIIPNVVKKILAFNKNIERILKMKFNNQKNIMLCERTLYERFQSQPEWEGNKE